MPEVNLVSNADAGIAIKYLLLFVHCFLLPPLFVGVTVLLCSAFCPFWFCSRPAGEEGVDCLLLLSSECCVTVVVCFFLTVLWVSM